MTIKMKSASKHQVGAPSNTMLNNVLKIVSTGMHFRCNKSRTKHRKVFFNKDEHTKVIQPQ